MAETMEQPGAEQERDGQRGKGGVTEIGLSADWLFAAHAPLTCSAELLPYLHLHV